MNVKIQALNKLFIIFYFLSSNSPSQRFHPSPLRYLYFFQFDGVYLRKMNEMGGIVLYCWHSHDLCLISLRAHLWVIIIIIGDLYFSTMISNSTRETPFDIDSVGDLITFTGSSPRSILFQMGKGEISITQPPMVHEKCTSFVLVVHNFPNGVTSIFSHHQRSHLVKISHFQAFLKKDSAPVAMLPQTLRNKDQAIQVLLWNPLSLILMGNGNIKEQSRQPYSI